VGKSVLEFKVKREKLFERSLPEARWNCEKYAPEVPKRKRWPLKVAK
jgi:hypothetical protein